MGAFICATFLGFSAFSMEEGAFAEGKHKPRSSLPSAKPLRQDPHEKMLQNTVLGVYLLNADYANAARYCLIRNKELACQASEGSEKKRVSQYFLVVYQMLQNLMPFPEFLESSAKQGHKVILGDLGPYLLKYSSFPKLSAYGNPMESIAE